MSRNHPDAIDSKVQAGCSTVNLLDVALNTVAVSAFAVNDLAARILDEPEPSTAAERRLRRQSNAMLLALALHNVVRAARSAISEMAGPHAEHIVKAFARFDAALPGARDVSDVLERCGSPCQVGGIQQAGIAGRPHTQDRDAIPGHPRVFYKVTDSICTLHVGPCALDVSAAREQAVALLAAIAEVCFDEERCDVLAICA